MRGIELGEREMRHKSTFWTEKRRDKQFRVVFMKTWSWSMNTWLSYFNTLICLVTKFEFSRRNLFSFLFLGNTKKPLCVQLYGKSTKFWDFATCSALTTFTKTLFTFSPRWHAYRAPRFHSSIFSHKFYEFCHV